MHFVADHFFDFYWDTSRPVASEGLFARYIFEKGGFNVCQSFSRQYLIGNCDERSSANITVSVLRICIWSFSSSNVGTGTDFLATTCSGFSCCPTYEIVCEGWTRKWIFTLLGSSSCSTSLPNNLVDVREPECSASSPSEYWDLE